MTRVLGRLSREFAAIGLVVLYGGTTFFGHGLHAPGHGAHHAHNHFSHEAHQDAAHAGHGEAELECSDAAIHPARAETDHHECAVCQFYSLGQLTPTLYEVVQRPLAAADLAQRGPILFIAGALAGYSSRGPPAV